MLLLQEEDHGIGSASIGLGWTLCPQPRFVRGLEDIWRRITKLRSSVKPRVYGSRALLAFY